MTLMWFAWGFCVGGWLLVLWKIRELDTLLDKRTRTIARMEAMHTASARRLFDLYRRIGERVDELEAWRRFGH